MYRIVEAGRGDDGSLGQRLFVDGLARRDGGDEPVPAVSSGVMGTGRVVSRPNYQVRPPDDPNDRDLQWHQLSYHRYRLYDFVCRHFADAGDEFRLAVCWCIEERILKQDDSFREDTCQYVVVRRMAIDVMFDTIDPYLTEHPESQKTLETLFSIGLLPEGFSIDSLPPIPKKPAAHPSPGQRSSTDKKAKKIEKKKPKPQEKRTTLVRDLFQIKDPKLAMALERVVTDMLGIRSPGTQKFRAFCKWFQRELLFAEDKPLVRELTNRLIVSSLGVDVESELDAIQSEVQVRILMNFVSQGNEYENLVFGTFQVFFEEVRAVTVRELDEVRGKVADILKQVSLQYDALLATRDGSKVWKIRVVKAYRGRAITFDQARELLYPGEEVDDLRVQNRVSKIALANPHERIRASRPTDLAVVTPDHVVAAIRYKKGEIPESEIGQFLGVSPDLWDNILFLRDRMKKQIRQRFPRWFTLAEVPRQRAPGRLFSGPLRKHIKLLRKRADGDLSDDEFALALGIPPDKQGAVTNAITAIRNAFPEETRLLVRPSGLSHQEKLGIITDYEGGDRSDALMERARVTNAASLQSTIYRWRNALARVGLYRRNKGSVDREIGTP